MWRISLVVIPTFIMLSFLCWWLDSHVWQICSSLYTVGSWIMNLSVCLLTCVIRPPTRERLAPFISWLFDCLARLAPISAFRHRLSGKSTSRKRNRTECRAWGTDESAPLNSQYNAPRTIFYSSASFVVPVSGAISTEYEYLTMISRLTASGDGSQPSFYVTPSCDWMSLENCYQVWMTLFLRIHDL